jgi:hypothetical protein
MYKAGGAKDPAQKTKRDLLIGRCWSFLYDNFHKFSQDNKIKISLELAKKNIPTEILGVPKTETKIIFITPKEREAGAENRVKAISV